MRVGITCRIVETLEYEETRDAVSHDLISFCNEQKAHPIIIPNNLEFSSKYMENLDLLVLSGGNDLSHLLEKNSKKYLISKKRDEVELNLIEIAIKNNIPILGICRGMQLINVYFGGELSSVSSSIHLSKKHMINFSKLFYEEFRIKQSLIVSSFHSFGISKLGSGLISVAEAGDGEIEAFKHLKHRIYGVMWHPERENKGGSFNSNLFRKIVN